ncbi:YihY/virulence factor BrkB family protein [Allorhizocola rhizosphaerae]|uniref:YihY/virulence factor BrkB family protein n=1 Tax=Allorhizocola rhizosphaerae TaxID=1872709 RepID=UPI0013C30DAA|nr:YhjD/YihY/BrkB family envelope integrity protein [Allorhizocola rhizosphaerae]
MSQVGVWQRLSGHVTGLRRRIGWLDHAVLAVVRYDRSDAGRLAAAVTYYAFFAVFSLALLGFAILGSVVDSADLLAAMQERLPQIVPRLDLAALRDARGMAWVAGLIVLPVSGVFWVDALRSAMRAVWDLPQYPGNFFARQLIDLLVLTGLGLLLVISLAIEVAAQNLLNMLSNEVMEAKHAAGVLPAAAGFVIGLAVNTGLSMAVLTGLPRLRMPLRRVWGPALLLAVGVQVLTNVGRVYVNAVAVRPVYQAVAAAVGLLVFLNLLNQLVLFACALTATSTAGTVTDMSAKPTFPPSSAVSGAGSSGCPQESAGRLENAAEDNGFTGPEADR